MQPKRRALLVVDVGDDSEDSLAKEVRAFIRDNRRWYDFFVFTLRGGADTGHSEMKDMRKHDIIPFAGVFKNSDGVTKFLVDKNVNDLDIVGDNFFGNIHRYGARVKPYVAKSRIIRDLTGALDPTFDLVEQATLEEVTGKRS